MKAIKTATKTATAMPAPIPALAPVESPPRPGLEVGRTGTRLDEDRVIETRLDEDRGIGTRLDEERGTGTRLNEVNAVVCVRIEPGEADFSRPDTDVIVVSSVSDVTRCRATIDAVQGEVPEAHGSLDGRVTPALAHTAMTYVRASW